MKSTITIIISFIITLISNVYPQQLNLNGNWEFGINRKYDSEVKVPGIVTNPTRFSPDKIWYKREIILPESDWKYATLQLKGALFSPEVYVNGVMVSKKSGGMAPTSHLLSSQNVKPGESITLEISLESLKNLSETDASYVPRANHWRSNISSYIWDDVFIKFHNEIRIKKLISYYDIENKAITFRYELENINSLRDFSSYTINLEITGLNNEKIIQQSFKKTGLTGEIVIPYGDKLQLWAPDFPKLYQANISIKDKNIFIASESVKIGIRQFEEKGKQFYLNNKPCKIRAGTVVWHRWSRDLETSDIIYDTTWFINNVIIPLKERGANTLRFHLGNPPERFLDLCDKYGLLVQYEWSFFHGMPASKNSLLEQWDSWINLAIKHPSVVLVHPYNETSSSRLKIAWAALDELLPNYPDLVLQDRDVIHVHKYWWGMFENVGLYFDSYDEFSKAIMVDEFGGNYLDGKANMGGYKSLKEAYLRFLGRNHTPEKRLYHHTISNSRIAEYWRRIGAAGFSPFCILGSYEDGNHWYVGDIHEGKLKPVWDALTASWSPISVSIDIWDRNFIPDQAISFPIHFFNDTENDEELKVNIRIEDVNGTILSNLHINKNLTSYSQKVDMLSITLPEIDGKYWIRAELLNPPACVLHPGISDWEVNVSSLKVDKNRSDIIFAIPADEHELSEFAAKNNLHTTHFDNPVADVVLTSANTWKKIAAEEKSTLDIIEKAINSGKSVIMLDIGDVFLGQGYLEQSKKMTHMQGRYIVEKTVENKYALINGIELSFQKIAEPESHIHPDKKNDQLWQGIPRDYTWIWNGLRGGLIVPASEMEISGLSPDAYLSNWHAKGAEKEKILHSENYYMYDLQGFYTFSDKPKDKEAINELKSRVKFIVEDAPALVNTINPEAPIKINNLSEGYKSQAGKAKELYPLVNCGRSLTRTPVILVDFGNNKGRLILSQLITKGRLANSSNNYKDLYDVRYDVVACQFVLNMINMVIEY